MLAALGCAAIAGLMPTVTSPAAALANCTWGQAKLSGQVSGATQSLLGTLTLTNRSGRACALPVAPIRASLIIGSQVLPTLAVRMRGSVVPPGAPTRRLPRRGHVVVGIQWRNWCGAPRGKVRLSAALTIFSSVTSRASHGVVSTPPCGDRRFSSRVAVSRFLKPSAA